MRGLSALSPQRDVSNERRSRGPEWQQYPSLKKSLSAPLSVSSRSPSRSRDSVHENDVPPTDGKDGEGPRISKAKRSRQTLSLKISKPAPPAEAALKALQYLPIPLLVLSGIKTIVLANEAMGRLLGLSTDGDTAEPHPHGDGEDMCGVDLLLGLSLSQIGVDMIQSGQRIWVSWEVIDHLISRLRSCAYLSLRNSSITWLKRWM